MEHQKVMTIYSFFYVTLRSFLLQTSTPSVKLSVSALGREVPAAESTSTVSSIFILFNSVINWWTRVDNYISNNCERKDTLIPLIHNKHIFRVLPCLHPHSPNPPVYSSGSVHLCLHWTPLGQAPAQAQPQAPAAPPRPLCPLPHRCRHLVLTNAPCRPCPITPHCRCPSTTSKWTTAASSGSA